MGQEVRRARERWDIKVAVAAIIVVAIILIGGLIYVDATRKREQGSSVLYYSTDHVVTLDPADADDVGSLVPASNIYETLIRYSPDEGAPEFSEGLATSWTMSPDGLWYNFTLRQGVRFSNGNAFTADDVKFTIERILSMASPDTGVSQIFSWNIDLNSTQVLDDYSLSIKLRQPFSGFLATVARPFPLSILDRESTLEHYSVVDKYAHEYVNGNPVGTGPYLLEKWQQGVEVVLARNPQHWRGWSGSHFDRVIIKEISTAESVTSALQTGNADIAPVSPANLSDIEGYPAIAVNRFRTYGIEVAVMNTAHLRSSHVFMRESRVRQALCYAFDYANTSVQLYRGYMEELRGCIPNGLPFSADAQPSKYFSYNMSAASRLLNESNYLLDVANHRFNGTTMVLVVERGDSLRMSTASSYAAALGRLGILTTVKEGNRSVLDKRGDWDLFFMRTGPRYPDPIDVTMQLLASAGIGGDYYHSGISDSVIDAAARVAWSSTSNQSRMEAYAQIWQESNANPNAILIGQIDCALCSKSIISGLQLNPVTLLDFYSVNDQGAG